MKPAVLGVSHGNGKSRAKPSHVQPLTESSRQRHLVTEQGHQGRPVAGPAAGTTVCGWNYAARGPKATRPVANLESGHPCPTCFSRPPPASGAVPVSSGHDSDSTPYLPFEE